MHRYKSYLITVVLCISVINAAVAQTNNILTKIEKQKGWYLLFDGKTFNGWQKLADTGWVIEEGELRAQAFNDGKQKDIITVDQFENFELSLEFKISKLTNSGIKYLVTDSYPGHEGSYLGLEYQILDDANYKYPDRGIYRSTASLYDLIPAKNKRIFSLDEWNTARIIVNENHIEHWLNGRLVVKYDRSTCDFNVLVHGSKYSGLKNFGKTIRGHILLQNEGTPIAFRNIKIKPLF